MSCGSTSRLRWQPCRDPPPEPLLPLLPVAGPKGFVPLRDSQDGYSFLYPFGWQEVTVDGQVRLCGCRPPGGMLHSKCPACRCARRCSLRRFALGLPTLW